LQRWQAGTLGEDEFKPLRLQNGWYVQRFAPMLRVAVPYGEIAAAQLRVLARIARDFDHKEAHDLSTANAALADVPSLPDRCAHFTTRQNVQFNWIPLARAADVMDLLASVNMHGIQTSGNCIRNITTDALAGIAVDEVADPRPFAEILRQWSTLHPEFAFLPRKFKVAITGATEDRAATPWHDVGLAPGAQRGRRAGLSRCGGWRHGPHPHHRQRHPRIPALEPDPQLPGSRWCAPTTASAGATTSTRPASRSW
jgi:sulfite reductase (NADPH) hemoprotein beta-component